MKIIKFAVSIIVMVVIGAMLAVSVYGAITSQPAILGGYGVTNIVSGSMEPTIMTDGYAVFETVDPSSLQEGDIIVFRNAGFGELNGQPANALYCHRIMGIDAGQLTTKGDNNDMIDPCTTDTSDVVGRVVYIFNGWGGLTGRDTVFAVETGIIVLCLFSSVLNARKRRQKEKAAAVECKS